VCLLLSASNSQTEGVQKGLIDMIREGIGIDEVRRGEVLWRGSRKIRDGEQVVGRGREREREKDGREGQLMGIKDRVSDNDAACDSNVLSCITILQHYNITMGCRTALLLHR
jgi:hypothetical protein